MLTVSSSCANFVSAKGSALFVFREDEIGEIVLSFLFSGRLSLGFGV